MIAQMRRFDALNTTQKTSALCKIPFLKKNKKKTVKNVSAAYLIRLLPVFDQAAT